MKWLLILLLGVCSSQRTAATERRCGDYLLNIHEGVLQSVTATGNSTDIDLSNLRIRRIVDNVFDNLTHLKHLNLSNNELEEVPPRIFFKLNNLEILSLADNQIWSFNGIFSGSNNLKTVDLSRNSLMSFPSASFLGLPKSTDIVIDGNYFGDLSSTAFGDSSSETVEDDLNADPFHELEALRALGQGRRIYINRRPDLKLCKTDDGLVKSLGEITGAAPLGDCLRVQFKDRSGEVDLRSLGVNRFQRGWYKLPQNWINGIDLSNNDISEITSEFLNDLPSNLHIIHLENNKLVVIRRNVIANRYLRELYLEKNSISIIEDGAFEKTELTKFIAPNNLLRSLSFAGTLPKTIEQFDAHHNELSEIPRHSLQNLKELKELDLSHNKLEKIEAGTFENLEKLRILELSFNQIEELNPGIFKGLINLKKLYLISNRIRKISQDSLSDLKNSVRLRIFLGFNKIDTIEEGSFANLNIDDLNLEFNKISEASIAKGAFNSTLLLRLDLSYNLFTSINGDSFYGISRSYNLLLTANRISSIEKGAARYMENVRQLLLMENPLERLENGALYGLRRAKGTYITLDATPIRVIQAGVFEDV